MGSVETPKAPLWDLTQAGRALRVPPHPSPCGVVRPIGLWGRWGLVGAVWGGCGAQRGPCGAVWALWGLTGEGRAAPSGPGPTARGRPHAAASCPAPPPPFRVCPAWGEAHRMRPSGLPVASQCSQFPSSRPPRGRGLAPLHRVRHRQPLPVPAVRGNGPGTPRNPLGSPRDPPRDPPRTPWDPLGPPLGLLGMSHTRGGALTRGGVA